MLENSAKKSFFSTLFFWTGLLTFAAASRYDQLLLNSPRSGRKQG